MVGAASREAESLNTITLSEEDGVTTLQTLVQHASREHRDGHVHSGMEHGMQASFDRLDALLDSAGTPAERYRRVAGRFTDRAEEMAAEAWDRPSPCEGWTGRDVVRHLVEWVPAMIGRAGVTFAEMPSVDRDPAGAWRALDASLQAALDGPSVASRRFDAGSPGELTVAAAIDIDMLITGDVLVHTWDLARTGGLDERLDAGHRHGDAPRHGAPRPGAARQRPLRASCRGARRRGRPDQAPRLHRPTPMTGSS